MMEARAGRGASRTRYRVCRLLRLLKDPDGMLVSRLLFCSGMGTVWAVKRSTTRHMVECNAPEKRGDGSESGAGRITHEVQSL